MAEGQFVKMSVEDRVALITLDYPPANVLNSTTVAELADAFQEALADEQVKAIVLTGGGEFIFIAGADINEIVRLESPGQAREIVQGAHKLLAQIESSPKPVIAAINGHCLGGGLELAMACHLRIANNRAQLGQPEIGLGIIPGFGGTQRLPRLVGKGKALELILTGDRISGAEAANLGLVNKAVPAGDVLRTALGLAKKIAGHGALAIRATIESVSRGLEMSLEQGLALETESFASLVGTHDMREGLSAFLEKRQPKFADQ